MELIKDTIILMKQLVNCNNLVKNCDYHYLFPNLAWTLPSKASLFSLVENSLVIAPLKNIASDTVLPQTLAEAID